MLSDEEELIDDALMAKIFLFCQSVFGLLLFAGITESQNNELHLMAALVFCISPISLYFLSGHSDRRIRAIWNNVKSQCLQLCYVSWNAFQRLQSTVINCLPQFLLTPLTESYEILNRPPICDGLNILLDAVIYTCLLLTFLLIVFNFIFDRDWTVYIRNFLLQFAFVCCSNVFYGTRTVSRIVNHVIYICLCVVYVIESLQYKTSYCFSYIVLFIFILTIVWHLLDCLFGGERLYGSQPDDGPPRGYPPGGSSPDDSPPGGGPPDDGPPDDGPPDDSSKPLKRGQWKSTSSGKKKGKKKR